MVHRGRLRQHAVEVEQADAHGIRKAQGAGHGS